jgi:hypothetical protein
MRQGPPAEPLQHDAVREREHELDAIAEKERMSEAAVPHHHPVGRFFARLFRRR